MTKNNVTMPSGSFGEGFRLEGSDMDWMMWSKQHRVIWNLSQIHHQYHHSHVPTHILADCSESPPGYALLHLHISTADEALIKACIRLNGKRYISSSIHRQRQHLAYGIDSKIHGPCVSVNTGLHEFDDAHCFFSDIWPPSASSWVERCQFWPPSHIVKNIVKGGCHFVAIGHKQGKHEDSEWRISFSLAEKKFVYSMNHCQFLTYGLLKIFLNEVINNTPDEDKLLCSYHVKTSVFWAIQSNTIPCLCPQNFLEGFWICFKLILKWVYEGYCPNFFIPYNNMFLTKVFGTKQKKLFFRLHALYEKGLTCLLESPTIKSDILTVLYNPYLTMCTDENILVSKDDFIRQMFGEMFENDAMYHPNLSTCVKVLHLVEQFIGSPLKQCQVLMLQNITVRLLQNTAFRRRYYEASSVLKQIQVKIAQPKRYSKAAGEDAWAIKMRESVGKFIDEDSRDISWQILGICQKISGDYQAALNSFQQSLTVDPYHKIQTATEKLDFTLEKQDGVELAGICTNIFLNEVINNTPDEDKLLCSYHVKTSVFWIQVKIAQPKRYSKAAGEDSRAIEMRESVVLIHQFQGKFIDEDSRDISWQILGICQQISGDYQADLYSFQQSLTVDPYHRIQTATELRIQDAKASYIRIQQKN
ncbi:uncharacterized protein LOC133193924 [Saccostrea echinata]|uniref:uncharacterized protein LOC133193924 n=1 Tax=Saccostrea echinata TaxID=191078 RepID=UPI002A7EF1DA|nr:uncharacterized protein LOC133193924 [Saccostrea echinata]